MESISRIFQKKYLRLLIWCFIGVIVVALLVPFALSFTPENIKKNEIKDSISKKISRDDFSVDEIIVEEDGWYYAKISFKENGGEHDNSSFAILHEEDGELVLKFGPGTSFDRGQLDTAGVPSVISKPQGSVPVDPIVKHLPYETDYFNVRIAAPPAEKLDGHDHTPESQSDSELSTVGTLDNKKELTVYVYEFPRRGYEVTPQKIAKHKNEITTWMQSKGLNHENYVLTFAVWPYGDY